MKTRIHSTLPQEADGFFFMRSAGQRAFMKSRGMPAGEKLILMKTVLIYGWGRRLGGERA